MIHTLIVDDETIMRVTMRSLIDWESHGYTIVEDCVSGAQALDYLRSNSIDLLITDMKMPGMTGLELIEQLQSTANMPVTVVLSGYNEFELVRKAFRLGAYDYLLKSDLNEDSLGRLLDTLRHKIFTDEAAPQVGRRVAPSNERPQPEPGDYAVAIFSVDSFAEQAVRFGSNLRQKLELPMLELARQIPRIAGHAQLRALDPSRYELCYHLRDRQQYRSTITSLVRQLQSVWRDYMNLSVSAAVSEVVTAAGVAQAVELCELLLKQAVLYGSGALVAQWNNPELTAAYPQQAPACDALIEALCTGEATRVEPQKAAFFGAVKHLRNSEHQLCYPIFIVRLGEKMREYGQDFFELFPEQTDYLAVLAGLQTNREQELWLRNLLRRAQDYFAGQHRQQQPDAIKKARLFMEDNYTNPALTLRTVADYVGYNEKYFSTRFAKECGCTFIAFLNQLRLQRAQLLITQTNLRMYEISEYVGYNNVEHFNHTFKRSFGISPSDYRGSASKT